MHIPIQSKPLSVASLIVPTHADFHIKVIIGGELWEQKESLLFLFIVKTNVFFSRICQACVLMI